MNIPPRIEKESYTYSFRVSGRSCLLIPKCKIAPTLKNQCWDVHIFFIENCPYQSLRELAWFLNFLFFPNLNTQALVFLMSSKKELLIFKKDQFQLIEIWTPTLFRKSKTLTTRHQFFIWKRSVDFLNLKLIYPNDFKAKATGMCKLIFFIKINEFFLHSIHIRYYGSMLRTFLGLKDVLSSNPITSTYLWIGFKSLY
jgi:hypothetical protein